CFIFKKDCIECKLKGKIHHIPYEHLQEAIKTRNYIILNLEDGKQYKFLCAEMKFYYEDLLMNKLQETSYAKKENS
ncbi:MAG TPA: hypothetical protein PLP05_11400, partial [Sedimentisphaerales bacterium]|nr:hypothetical protein [Sedimentisphaerales bacterium]